MAESVTKERKMKNNSQALALAGKPVKRSSARRLVLAMAGALAVMAMAGPSWADGDDWNHGPKNHGKGWGHEKHYQGYGYAPPPRYYYPPPPRVIYAPPPVYYYPPPRVIYAPPPPVYYYPQPGFQVVVPIHID
jgi:hypothetical protein